jgi:hypothetical protein
LILRIESPISVVPLALMKETWGALVNNNLTYDEKIG